MPPLSEDTPGAALPAATPQQADAGPAGDAEGDGGGGGEPAAGALAEAQTEDFLQRWDYVSSEAAYAKELRELVKKSPAGDELWSR